MSLWKIAWRSIRQRGLASALTAVSMGLGVALVVAVLVVYAVVDQSFRRGGEGYDLIVGAKGGQLQLVLNTVYYLSQPIENIPYEYYQEFTTGRFALDVEAAVPVCMGHHYRDYRVVGTTPAMFEKLTYRDNRPYRFAQGENFKADAPFEAVIGATVAREAGMAPGSTFQAIHGVPEQGGKAHKQDFTVVGVLEPTGTPNDRAMFVNMEGFYQIHAKEHAAANAHHDKQGGEEEHHEGHEEHQGHDHAEHECEHGPGCQHHHHGKEITAILVCADLSKPGITEVLARQINKDTVAQAVVPVEVIAGLFEGIVGNVRLILLLLAVLVVVVAGLGILVSIYNSMSERRHEIAVMRALGASRLTVMLVILLEAILLSLAGGAIGVLLGHGLIGVLSPVIADQTGVMVSPMEFQALELLLIPGLVALASVVGYLPAMAAYRTDVAKSLTANP